VRTTLGENSPLEVPRNTFLDLLEVVGTWFQKILSQMLNKNGWIKPFGDPNPFKKSPKKTNKN